MNLARRRAADLGVDRLAWEITDHPEEAFSRRFVRRSPDHAVIEREVWDDNNLGNAIANATPRARIDVHRPMPGLPLFGRSKRQLRLETEVRNLSSRPFPAQASYERRLVRLGAQLCASDGVRHESRPRPSLAPKDTGPRRVGQGGDRRTYARIVWTVRAEVRLGVRRGRLVRKLRVGNDDDATARVVRRFRRGP